MRTKLASSILGAKENLKCKFISLVYLLTEDFLKDCFQDIKRDKAFKIDGVSVRQYRSFLEENKTRI